MTGKDERMDFGKMAAEASYIEERRSSESFVCKEDEHSEERFLAWQKLLNVVPDKDVFTTRLEKDGISRAEALAICGSAVLRTADTDLPRWAKTIQAVMQQLPVTESELWEQTALKREDISLVGPISALIPFVVYAEKRLKEKYRDLPMSSLSEILLHRVYFNCSQTFNARARRMVMFGQAAPGENQGVWEKMGKELIGGEWINLLEEYPVLAKVVGTTIENYLTFIMEFLERFYDKKALIEETFFGGEPLGFQEIKGEISDLHQGGKSVLILSFDNRRKLVYKPRSLEIDTAWETFLSGFATGKSSIRAPHALDFGVYGFIEYVEHKPCESEAEVGEYFYNAGALMALLYCFAGNDFHMENIIACGKVPVLVDTETLMIPVARPFVQGGKDLPTEENSEETLEERMERSVLKIGFLPFWQKDKEDKRVDYGGLTGDKTDMQNLPLFDGKKYGGNAYPEKITEGFCDMYEHVLAQREALLSGENGLALFSHCKFRMLIRSSQVYGNVIQHITQPAFLKNGFDYSMKTERMVNAFLYEATEEIAGQVLKVFKAEQTAILRGDLPIFYCEPSGEGILDETGMLFDRYFQRSAVGSAADRISLLDEEDKKLQKQIIEKSLASEVRNVHEYSEAEEDIPLAAESGVLLCRDELLAEAEQIFSEIMENRFGTEKNNFSWFSEQYDLMRGGTSLSLMGPSIYDGLSGIALFMSALYAVTGNEEPKEAAEACIRKTWSYLENLLPNMERYQMPIGYSSGMAGYLNALLLVSRYLKSDETYGYAIKVVKAITPKMIENDVNFDVLAGTSGMIFSLTQDERLLRDPAVSEHVRTILAACGEHLLARRKPNENEGFSLWELKECTRVLTGLGHGVAGIAAMLFRLYEVFADERYLEAGREAITYENRVFDETAGNWPDFRRDPDNRQEGNRFMAGYCAGAPGIGLARLDSLKHLPTNAAECDIFRKDIQRADRFVRSMGKETRNHLCCGSAGRIDFLIEESLTLGSREAMELAQKKASALIHAKKQRGHYNFHVSNGRYYYNPTLFQGTAGIGYELLRLIEPEKIRSILI